MKEAGKQHFQSLYSKATLFVCSTMFTLAFLGCSENSQSGSTSSNPTTVTGNYQDLDQFKGELISCHKMRIENTAFYQKMSRGGKLKDEVKHLDDIELFDVQYQSDGLTINGFIVRPKAAGNYPLVVFNHAFKPKRSELNEASALQAMGRFAANGYTMFASNYRGWAGSDGSYEYGGADLQDVLNIIPAAAELPGVDTSRIGLFGLQRGALINLMTLRNSKRFDCAINFNAMVNMEGTIDSIPLLEEHLQKHVPNYDEHKEQALINRTPLRWANELHKAPLLFVQRHDDGGKSYTDLEKFSELLTDSQHPHHLVTVKGKRGMAKHRNEIFKFCNQWLDTHLKGLNNFEPEGDATTLESDPAAS